MVLDYFVIILIACLLAILTNYVRFKGGETFNKWILVISSVVFIEIYGYIVDYAYFSLGVLLVISLSVVSFGLVGGLVTSILAFLQLQLHLQENALLELCGYIVLVVGLDAVRNYLDKVSVESKVRLSTLLSNSKQLNVFREVSLAMQQTLKLEKLLQTILTSVTAGRGLGFNRSIIMLTDESATKLMGMMGTGPMTVEEGFATWEEISKNKYKLADLIQIKETVETTDQSLNERVKSLEISLEQESFLSRTLSSGMPIHIKQMDQSDKLLMDFVTEFNIKEFVVFPLINQGHKVGVLMVDNPVNKMPITAEKIDSVIPLANQAAIAIHHSHLYNKIEDMALRDGLTGLFNQRAFQKRLEEYSLEAYSRTLSLIMIDIDYFKHFNDTNGHLEGNQVLITLANVIRHTLTSDQLAFRFGGEEFAILLPNYAQEQAIQVAEQLRANVANTSFSNGEKQPMGRLTISVGVSSMKVNHPLQMQKLIDAADKALYEAKRNGKNRVVVDRGVLQL